MDNKKIGNLIAKLRREKGLTQQELGDMVGIGFRAVSKWERGVTMPDISLINELSKILGITSDELLSGELNKSVNSKEKNKLSKPIKITISIITIIILFITSIIIYQNNKTYLYEIKKIDSGDYYISGQITFERKQMNITINELALENKELLSTKIKNYQYEIYSNDNFIFGYGQNDKGKYLEEIMTIEELINNIKINYTGKTYMKYDKIINNNLIIRFNFIDENNQTITKEIICTIY